jgi:nitrogen fixation protein NifU and related proteins
MTEEELMEHFNDPLYFGRPQEYDLEIKGSNVSCGDYLTLFLKYSQDNEHLESLFFESDACSLCTASTSIFLKWINEQNLNLKDIHTLDEEKIFELLGFKPSMNRIKCCTLCIKTLKAFED